VSGVCFHIPRSRDADFFLRVTHARPKR